VLMNEDITLLELHSFNTMNCHFKDLMEIPTSLRVFVKQ
jgi:hypothetical protein